MTTYTCKPYKPVRQGDEYWWHDRRGEPDSVITVNDAKDAARVFATRLARKRFGHRGAVVTSHVDNWSADGRYVNVQCFIGYRCDGGGYNGQHEYFTVYVNEGN
jgi:hypothetical protein